MIGKAITSGSGAGRAEKDQHPLTPRRSAEPTRAYRAGGFAALVPAPRRLAAQTPPEVLDYFPEPAPLQAQPKDLPLEERYDKAYTRLRDAQMPEAEKAEVYRQLRDRQRLEELTRKLHRRHPEHT